MPLGDFLNPVRELLIFLRILNSNGTFNLLPLISAVGAIVIVYSFLKESSKELYKKIFHKISQLYKGISDWWGSLKIKQKYALSCLILVIIVLLIIVLSFLQTSGDCLGRSVDNAGPIFIYPEYFDPSGKIGDINDIIVEKGTDKVRFVYEIRGRPPHEGYWKYIDNCSLNPEPAQFGGVIYLNPPNNWGDYPGWDLRHFRKTIKWEARSVNNESYVEFFIGGVKWNWTGCNKLKVPCPDSMPRESLGGTIKLTEKWQEFNHDLSNCEENYFKNVVGGFGWVIDWGSNRVYLNETRTGPKEPKTLIIEIRNIRFEGN